MENISRILLCCALFICTALSASTVPLHPHALRIPKAAHSLPKNKDAQAFLAAITKKTGWTVLLSMEQLDLLEVKGGTSALPGIPLEEVVLNGANTEYTIFLLPDEQGFGASFLRGDEAHLYKFSRELQLISAWSSKDGEPNLKPVKLKDAKRASMEILLQWKNFFIEK